MILELAEAYGQSPESVRNWPVRDHNLAILKIRGENEKQRRENERRKKARK